ncbi:doubled motif LPXTG anchor domain-containing protein [Clostridium sp. MCC353]|uniref:doubled motif LPXTG anchor domain-containing protein n=1 Tax=Clostridium sp. MCC353 TaxID=2592646 RepID=UPI001C027BAB|nr:doubled motif LPXTG anchor domain-containing protein [Clostridium sp. MCC353]MBT9774905.1 doubled motif LPXTG anchor domain-containing protein [Clostridium sp. MCC353]
MERKRAGSRLINLLWHQRKRATAFLLAFAMTFVNIANNVTIAFASVGQTSQWILSSDAVVFELDAAELSELAKTTVVNASGSNALKTLEFKGESELAAKYNNLFGGGIEEINPSFDSNNDDISLRVFVKDNERVIFLFINSTEDTYECAVNISGYLTETVFVEAYTNAVMEEVPSVIKPEDNAPAGGNSGSGIGSAGQVDAAESNDKIETDEVPESETNIQEQLPADVEEDLSDESAGEENPADNENVSSDENNSSGEQADSTDSLDQEKNDTDGGDENNVTDDNISSKDDNSGNDVSDNGESSDNSGIDEMANDDVSDDDEILEDGETSDADDVSNNDALDADGSDTEGALSEENDLDSSSDDTSDTGAQVSISLKYAPRVTSSIEEMSDFSANEDSIPEEQNSDAQFIIDDEEIGTDDMIGGDDSWDGTEENYGTIDSVVYETAGLDGSGVAAIIISVSDLELIELQNEVFGDTKAYHQVTYQVDEAGAIVINGAKKAGDGEDLTFIAKPQAGYTIESVSINGEETDPVDENEYLIEDIREDIIVSIITSEEIPHPEFAPEPITIGDVVISVYAEQGIIPEGTEFTAEAVDAEKQAAIEEEVIKEAEKNLEEVLEALSYEINLIYQGEKLTWNEGTVQVSFSGAKIEENSAMADKVDISYVETDSGRDVELDTVASEEVPGDMSVETIGFDARHFSTYTVTFIRNSDLSRVLNVHINSFDNYQETELEQKHEPVSLTDNGDSQPVEAFVESHYTANGKNYEFSKATAENRYEAPKVKEIALNENELKAVTVSGAVDPLGDNELYLWYVPVEEQIRVTIVKIEDGTESEEEGSIPAGIIVENIPEIPEYDFVNAKVGDGVVTYVTRSGDTVFYGDDTLSGDGLAYALKDNEEIKLYYEKAVKKYNITYEEAGDDTDQNSITGPVIVKDGSHADIQVNLGLGYKAVVTVNGNQIAPAETLLDGRSLNYVINNIKEDKNVIVTYEKVETFVFDPTLIKTEAVSKYYHNAEYAPEKETNISRGETLIFKLNSEYGKTNWQLNGFQINGVDVAVPNSYEEGAESSFDLKDAKGDIITKITIHLDEVIDRLDWGRKYQYRYTVTFADVMSDLQITGGNFRAASWSEIMPIEISEGVKVEYRNKAQHDAWTTAVGSKPIGYSSQGTNNAVRFRYEVQPGYKNLQIKVQDGTLRREDAQKQFTVSKAGKNLTTLSVTVELINYQVEYDADGGSGAPSDSNKYNIINNSTVYIPSGIPVNSDERIGFLGWMVEGDDSKTLYSPNSAVLLTDLIGKMEDGAETIKFKAKWSEPGAQAVYVPFSIEYWQQTENGSYERTGSDNKSGLLGSKLILQTANYAARYYGYTFNIGKSEVVIDNLQRGQTMKLYYDLNHYTAEYRIIPSDAREAGCSLSRYSEEFSVLRPVSGSTAKDSVSQDTDSSYTFAGWYSDAAGTKLISENNEFIPHGLESAVYYAKFTSLKATKYNDGIIETFDKEIDRYETSDKKQGRVSVKVFTDGNLHQEGTVYFRYENYNCVDLTVNELSEQDYILNRIYIKQSLGATKDMDTVYRKTNMGNLDNVADGSTVYFYLTSKYAAEYQVNDTEPSGLSNAVPADHAVYTVKTPKNQISADGYKEYTNPELSSVKETITVKALPDVRNGYSITGWSSKMGDKTAGDQISVNGNLQYAGDEKLFVFHAEVSEQQPVTITYEALEGGKVRKNGESELSGSVSEELAPATGIAAGAVAVADNGYSFGGWYKDAECKESVGSETVFIPAKEDGSYKKVVYYAKFNQNPDVTIFYRATEGGKVSLSQETTQPVTGTVAGSEASAEKGYHFINWTDVNNKVVGTELKFVPEKVNGLIVSGTYTANFAKNYELTIEAGNAEKEYDGTPLVQPEFSVIGLQNGHHLDETSISTSGSITNYGTSGSAVNRVVGTPVILDENGKDATGQYDIKIKPGTLKINKRTVTITVNSASKEYGQSDPEFKGSVDGLLKEDDLGEIAYKRIESDKDKENVGDDITLTAEWVDNSNYNVSEVITGKLVITPIDGNGITVESGIYDYDGEPHGLKSAEALKEGSTVLYQVGEGEWTDTMPRFTEAGSYEVKVKASNPNYKDTQVVIGNVTINKKKVEIRVDDAEKVFGSTDPDFTGEVGTLVSTNDLGEIAYIRDSKDAAKENVGDVIVITASYTPNKNYDVTVIPGKLVITKASGVNAVKAEGETYTYDGTYHGLKSAEASVDGSTLWYKTGEGQWTNEEPEFKNAGTYTVTVKATHPNYTDTDEVTAEVFINQANITIRVNSASKPYGTPDPKFDGTIEGLVKGDILGNVSYVRQEADIEKQNVGDLIGITAVYSENPNYQVTVVDGSLTITKALSGNSVTVIGTKGTYNGNGYELTEVKAEQAGSTVYYRLRGTEEWSETAPSYVNTGSYTIEVMAVNPNYADTEVAAGIIEIKPADVTITVDNKEKSYGQDDPKFTGTISGLVDDADLGDITYGRKPEDKDKTNAGEDITIIPNYVDNSNYKIEVTPGKLTINKADGNVLTVEGSTHVYDSYAYGLAKAEAEQPGSTVLYREYGTDEWTEIPPVYVNAGVYKVDVKAVNDNYKDTEIVTGTVQINKYKVEITVDSKEKQFNTSDPKFTGTVGRLVAEGDLGVITYNREAGDEGKENVGSDITITAYYKDNSNYEVSVTDGKLTIIKAETGNAVYVSGSESTYDGLNHGLAKAEAEEDGSTVLYREKGSETWSQEAPVYKDAGTYTIEVKAEHPNYADTEIAEGTIVINKAPVSIVADSKSKEYLADDPDFTGSVGGLAEPGDLGTVTFIRAEGDETKNNVGDDITITASYTPNDNYTVTVIPGKLEITAIDGNGVNVTGSVQVYDGEKHGLTSVKAEKTGSTIWYKYHNSEWSQEAPVFTEAGSYEVKVKATNPNYKETAEMTGTVIINKAQVKITVHSKEKEYKESDPVFTGTVGKLVKEGDLGTVRFGRDEADALKENAGDDITLNAFYASNNNYDVEVQTGKLTITKAKTGNDVTVEGSVQDYDGQNHSLKSASAAMPGSMLMYQTGDSGWNNEMPVFMDAGTYTVNVKAVNPNYEDTPAVSGTVIINKVKINLKAVDAQKSYGEKDPVFEGIMTGTLVDENDLGDVTYGRVKADGEKENVGDDIALTAFYQPNSNYEVTVTDGKLWITKALSGNSVTAEGSEQFYDGDFHSLKSAAAEIAGSELWYKTGEENWSTTAPEFVNAGSYEVKVKAVNPNYADTEEVTAVVLIKKAPVTIDVNNKSKTYGTTDPVFDGEIKGLINEDDLGTVFYGRTEEDASKNNVGDEIALTASYTENSNYEVTVNKGMLTINAADDNRVSVEGSVQDYDGEAHGLTSALASKPGSTLLYQVEGGAWSEEEPTFTEAGEYEVKVKAVNPNYVDTAEVSGIIVINKAKVEINVDSKSKTFGTDDPVFTGTVGKLVSDGDLGDITFGRIEADASKNNVGDDITLTASYTPNQNYEVAIKGGKLIITAADDNIVNVEGSIQDYDGKGHGLKTASALKPGSTLWYKTNGDWTTKVPEFIDAGTYEVKVKASNPNYTDTPEVSASVVINQISVEITVDNKSKRYGSQDPEFTGKVGRLVSEDDLGTVTYARRTEDADKENTGDDITIIASYQENNNYKVNVIPGKLEILKAVSGNSVTVEGNRVTYDGGSHGLKQFEALQSGSTILFREKGGLIWSDKAPVYVNAGTYEIEAKATHPNYNDTEIVTGSVVIDKADVTITVDSKSKTYGEADPKFTGTVTGLIGEYDLGTITYHRIEADTEKKNAGDSIELTADYLPNSNYEVKVITGNLTIAKKEVRVTVNDKQKIYGDDDPKFTADLSGVLDGEHVQYRLIREIGENVGSYQITAVPEINNNYQITVIKGTFDIQPKDIQITVLDKVKIYGDEDPEFTAVIDGLVGNDTLDYKLSREPGEDVGDYTIQTELGDNKNYTIDFRNGKLTVNPKNVTITIDSVSKTYGEADPGFTGTVTGLVRENDLGTVQYHRTSEDVDKENAGEIIAITAAYTANSNYIVSVVNGTLTIVSATDNAVNVTGRTVEYDGNEYGLGKAEALRPGSTLHYSTDGTNFTTDTPQFSEVGTHTVFVKAVNPNYADTPSVTAEIIINRRPITITAGSASKRYDGTGLTNNQAEITGGSLVKGHSLVDVNVTGSQTTIGTSENVASHAVIMAGGKDVTSNYSIIYVNGTLTITRVSSGNSGGGGGNSGTTPGRGNGGDTGNGPGSTTINPTEVPLAGLPNDITTGENILIDDGEIPLAALPKTGNQAGMNAVLAMLSGMLLAAYLTLSKKKDEES